MTEERRFLLLISILVVSRGDSVNENNKIIIIGIRMPKES